MTAEFRAASGSAVFFGTTTANPPEELHVLSVTLRYVESALNPAKTGDAQSPADMTLVGKK